MVSASTGALLIPHLPEPARQTGLALCAVMFAVALTASAPLLAIVVHRTLAGRLGGPQTVPTLAIVLGPLGQSATAAHLLGDVAGGPWRAAAVAYAVPVLAAALVWLAVVACLTMRTARTGLPFGLTWWSFTFPVGTVVTGTSGLALALRSHGLTVLAVALFTVLVTAWAVVAALTARGAASGVLLAAPQTV
jgi:tellurite resistance protein TehA-like permease